MKKSLFIVLGLSIFVSMSFAVYAESGGNPSLIQPVDWWPFSLRAPYGAPVDIQDPHAVFIGMSRFRVPGPPADIPEALRFAGIPVEIADALAGDRIIGEATGFERGYYVAHFDGIIQREWKQELSDQGVVFLNYIPNNAMVCYLTEATAPALVAHGHVDWIGSYHPAYKISPNVGYLPHRVYSDNPEDVLLTLALFPGAPMDTVLSKVQPLVTEVVDSVELPLGDTGTQGFIHVVCLPEVSLDLAFIPEISYIEQQSDTVLKHAFSAGSLLQVGGPVTEPSSVTASNFPFWVNQDLQGQGQVIGISDSGIDRDHVEFADPVNPALAAASGMTSKIPREVLVGTCTSSCDSDIATANGGHGTSVAAAAAQDHYGNDAANYQVVSGTSSGYWGPAIAHEAQLIIHPWETSMVVPCTGNESDVLSAWEQMADLGACVINTSIRFVTGNAYYDTQSYNYDYLTRVYSGGYYTAMTNAAGNDGYCDHTGDPAANEDTAAFSKNALHVGATEDLDWWEDIASFSSRGPNYDGRIFPDVVAPGTDSQQTNVGLEVNASDGDCASPSGNYIEESGTSFSAPEVAGVMAIIRQYFTEGFYPTGTADAGDAMTPSGALLKAMVLNSTERIVGLCNNDERPGKDQGWGFPVLSNILKVAGSAFNLMVFDVAHDDGFTAPGQSTAYHVKVNSASEPLKVTLVWMDWPASPGTTGAAIVNDLDLTVTGPAGTFYGNNFDASTGWSVTGAYDDDLNTAENVFISASDLAPGNYTITVSCESLNGGISQGYALVVTGDVEEAVLVPALTWSGILLLLAGLPVFFFRKR